MGKHNSFRYWTTVNLRFVIDGSMPIICHSIVAQMPEKDLKF